MTGLLDRPLAPVFLSTSTAKGRKYPHTLEMLQPDAAAPVGVTGEVLFLKATRLHLLAAPTSFSSSFTACLLLLCACRRQTLSKLH